jgi:hypothetical protein
MYVRLEDRLRQDKGEITKLNGVDISRFKYAVYAGGENFDLANGKGEPSILCQSEAQAKYMSGFWGHASHYEELVQEGN